MKNLKLTVWIFLLWLVQTVFSKYIRINGVVPELLYMFVICVSLLEKKQYRYITVGIVCGIIADAIVKGSPGFNLLIYTCTVFATVCFCEFVYRDIFFLIIPISAVFTFCENTIFYFITQNNLNSYVSALKTVIFPVIIYNVAAAVIIKFLLKKTVYARNRGSRRR